MQAGEIGVQLKIFPYKPPVPANPINLLGSTCTLAVQAPTGILTSLPLIVFTDGTYAYRYTLATDFPIGGIYEIQMIADFGSTTELKSPIQSLPVELSLE